MAKPRDEVDAKLLNAIQEGVPLEERPFEALAQRLKADGSAPATLDENQVLERLSAMKSPPQPVIRQISAIFDTKALGYRSTLVAAKVDPNHIDSAAQIINRHPGVTHNYKRNHDFNLWYTLAVPPDSALGLEKTLEVLHRQSGALSTRMLPTLKLFKIGVKLNVAGDADITARSDKPRFSESHRKRSADFVVTDADKRMIRVLQQDLPLIARPFDQWAQQAQVSVPQLLEAARRYEQMSVMRRFSAVLHHREVGFSANGMGVWAVPEDQCEQFGQTAARYQAVSHCYLRPTYPDWPYSIFTMVHAPSEPECNAVLKAISDETGVKEYVALYSSVQYKKTRLKYFTDGIEQWEHQAASQLG